MFPCIKKQSIKWEYTWEAGKVFSVNYLVFLSHTQACMHTHMSKNSHRCASDADYHETQRQWFSHSIPVRTSPSISTGLYANILEWVGLVMGSSDTLLRVLLSDRIHHCKGKRRSSFYWRLLGIYKLSRGREQWMNTSIIDAVTIIADNKELRTETVTH